MFIHHFVNVHNSQIPYSFALKDFKILFHEHIHSHSLQFLYKFTFNVKIFIQHCCCIHSTFCAHPFSHKHFLLGSSCMLYFCLYLFLVRNDSLSTHVFFFLSFCLNNLFSALQLTKFPAVFIFVRAYEDLKSEKRRSVNRIKKGYT